MRRLITATLVSLGLTLTGVHFSPAATATEWLYVLASEDIRVVPGSGNAGRVILRSDIEAVQFTDRPERTSRNTTPRTVLRDFGWTQQGGALTGKVPNAAISISGSTTQVVEIRRASVAQNKVTLFVRGLGGPLAASAGSGAVFIDDASGEQATQLSASVLATSNYNPQGPAISVTLESNAITLWSGTLSPSNPSATVPNSVAGSTSVSGTLQATFTPTGAQIVFSGTTTDNGAENQLTGLLIGSWSDS